VTNAEKFLEEFGNIDDEFLKEAMNFTMKKKFNFKPIIAIAACAAFALAAIPLAKHFAGMSIGGTSGTTVTTQAPEVSFNVLYAGGADGGLLGADIEIETDFDGMDEYFTDKTKLGTKKTVIIHGVEYTGTYKNSTRSDYYGDDTDNYVVGTGTGRVEFSINCETGVMVKFSFTGDHSTGKKLTKDECYDIAIEHLKKYVPNIEEYELTMAHNQGGKLGYLFRFFRMFNGMKTSESIDVRVDHSGEVYNHSLYSIGIMKDLDMSAINMDDVNKVISDKLSTMYKEYETDSFSPKNIMLAKLADGNYIFVYKLGVNVIKDGKSYTDYCEFVVEIN
jgi:hypothetical protein